MTVGKAVTDTIMQCLKDRNRIGDLNEPFIALILKIKDPKVMVVFRPISLGNVVYKILSKVLNNKLKVMVSQCLISNNIIVTQ